MLTIGVLGGMGPLATADLMMKIVGVTPAGCDQEHVPVLVYNNSQIPSRIEALLSDGTDPLKEMVRSARCLEKAGADFLIMPCNTAHYWYQSLKKKITVPLLHMIELTAQAAAKEQNARLLLLATAATVNTGLYQKAFAKNEAQLILPDAAEQALVSRAIEGVKAGHVADNACLADLNRLLERQADNGAEGYIGGCTEIPLLFPYLTKRLQAIDPTLLLAKAAVEAARSGRIEPLGSNDKRREAVSCQAE
ncbi:aspartate/glutamate racemase family protein [Azotosporobacter soli]|uniref:aspartate/glutamate racemase family protein n=1 Tax=Azotosporobacter soli TaxID=3055040 RepID=UPI0031FF1646